MVLRFFFFNQVQYFFHNVMLYNNKHKSKNCLSYILTTILETLKETASQRVKMNGFNRSSRAINWT